MKLLERDAELTVLSEAVARVRDGQGSFVMIEATAGLGKTQLLAWAKSAAAAAGLRTITARGMELEQEFSFGVTRQLFEPLLADADGKQKSSLFEGVATQASMIFEPSLSSSAIGDFAALHGLYWLMVNLCRRGTAALIIDDLHWADMGSLRFLVHLLVRMEGLPLLVIAASRPNASDSRRHLIDLMVTDPTVNVLRLASLSGPATAQIVRSMTGSQSDELFCSSCHTLTGGNPLLLNELLTHATMENIPPTASGASRLGSIGGDAIGRRITVQLASLPPSTARFARIASVLGESVDMAMAAHLSGISINEAIGAAQRLADVGICQPGDPLDFTHPLIRMAVYCSIDPVDLGHLHHQAARVCLESSESAQRAASHLLHTPPGNDREIVRILRRAADEALSAAAPDSALAYLERALRERAPGDDGARQELLMLAGNVARNVDLSRSAGYLSRALAVIEAPEARLDVLDMLGNVLSWTDRRQEALPMYQHALAILPEEESDLRRRLQAGSLFAAMGDAKGQDVALDLVGRLRHVPHGVGVGGAKLDALIAWYDATVSLDRGAALEAARRALANDTLLVQDLGQSVQFALACWVLAAADHEEAIPFLEAAAAQAHRNGSTSLASTIAVHGGLASLYRGSLAEAESLARQGMQLIDAISLDIGRPYAAAVLADVLMERGDLSGAAAALRWVSRGQELSEKADGWLLCSRARLLIRNGALSQGLDLLDSVFARPEMRTWRNPALLDWRADAAFALHELERHAEAEELMAEELDLARRWGSPRVLGRALRAAGVLAGGRHGLTLLYEAADVLKQSSAQLELAKAHYALGMAIHQDGQPHDARPHLSQALDLAEHCGATLLVQQSRAELRAAGARPRRSALSGPRALTPSELRVAQIAGEGHTNRKIAQLLFVTPKTVEVHLSSVYRKLGVRNRREMMNAMSELSLCGEI